MSNKIFIEIPYCQKCNNHTLWGRGEGVGPSPVSVTAIRTSHHHLLSPQQHFLNPWAKGAKLKKYIF